jgi:hypothetical protein
VQVADDTDMPATVVAHRIGCLHLSGLCSVPQASNSVPNNRYARAPPVSRIPPGIASTDVNVHHTNRACLQAPLPPGIWTLQQLLGILNPVEAAMPGPAIDLLDQTFACQEEVEPSAGIAVGLIGAH